MTTFPNHTVVDVKQLNNTIKSGVFWSQQVGSPLVARFFCIKGLALTRLTVMLRYLMTQTHQHFCRLLLFRTGGRYKKWGQ